MATATPSLTLTHTSDMMQNYIPGEIVSATSKFEALQTQDGHSMLFAMSSANVLEVILEQSGVKGTGWELVDLSSAALASNFSTDTSAAVQTFAANQSAVDGTIGVALVVSSDGSDNLLLCLENSNSDTSWINNPTWTLVPFDAPNASGTPISIVGIMFAETAENTQHIVVDINRSSNTSTKDIVRYYVKPQASGNRWKKHDVSVDIQDGTYQSCVGRVQGGIVDGIYTSGISGTSAQLVYQPISNAFGIGPPPAQRLSLPGGATPSAIATARNVDYSTDLYAVSGSTLYRVPAADKADGTVAATLFSNNFFLGTSQLSAMTHNGTTTIWGKNSNNQVYYISCSSDDLANPASWSLPIPILTGVESISPYLNRCGGGNNIFAAGGNKLYRLRQATNTEAKLWRTDEIILSGASPLPKAVGFMSYTTTIQLINEQNQPAGGVNVSLATVSRTPVYINGSYYVLSQAPVTVATDATGTLTVVEAIHSSINGTTLTVTCDAVTGSATIDIDPTDQQFQKIAQLNTEQKLSGATVAKNVVAGGTQGPSATASLVPSSTSSNDVQTAASGISNLSTVYGSVKPASPNPSPSPSAAPNPNVSDKPTSTPTPAPGAPFGVSFDLLGDLGDIGHDIEAAAGDIYHYLKSGVDHLIQIVKDTASDVWHFVATIAGKVYRAVLSTAEAVVGAVEWVFNAIETAIEDIIRFLELLLEWDDITRTKEVICNITKQWLQGQVDLLPNVQSTLDNLVSEAETKIDQWAGVSDWSTTIGEAAASPASASGSNPTAGQTSGSQMLANHYKNNGSDLIIVGSPPSTDAVQQLFDDLLTALESEEQVLSNGYTKLQALAKSFSSMPLGQVLKDFAAILVDDLLSSVRVVADAVLKILVSLASTAMDVLNTKIHIPVISDILSALGIPELSFLDLLCWIPAVVYTVIYELANGQAPFPDNSSVQAIINADNWNTIETSIVSTEEGIPKTDIYNAGHAIAGIMGLISGFVSPLEADGSSDASQNPWSKPLHIINTIGAALDFTADLAMPRDPIQEEWLKEMSTTTGVVSKLSTLIFGKTQKYLKGKSPNGFFTANDGRAAGAVVNVIFVFPELVVTIGHFRELSSEAANADRTAAIIQETAKLSGLVARVAYCVAVNDPEPVSKLDDLLVLGIATFVEAGLQTALCLTT